MRNDDWWLTPLTWLVATVAIGFVSVKLAFRLTGRGMVTTQTFIQDLLGAPRGVQILAGLMTVVGVGILVLLRYWFYQSLTSSKQAPRGQRALKALEEKSARRTAITILSESTNEPLKKWPTTDLARSLGLYQDKTLWGQWEDSEIVVAVSRRGKTRSLVAKRIIEAPGPVLTTSTKPDVIALTHAPRADRRGSGLYAFDPLGISHGIEKIGWNPVVGCEDIITAKRRAAAFVYAGGGAKDNASSNTAWFNARSAQILAYFFHAAALTGQPLTQFRAWLNQPRTVEEILRTHCGAIGEDMAEGLHNLLTEVASDTGSGFKATIAGALQVLEIPSVRECLTVPFEQSFTVEPFLTSTDTIYVLCEQDQESVTPITTMFVDEVHAAFKKASNYRPGGRFTPPVSFILDEAANVAPLPGLVSMFTEDSGRGLFLSVLFQDWSQVVNKWGRDGADSLFQEARFLYAFGGSKDENWNRRISHLTGKYEARHETVSTSTRASGVQVSTTTKDKYTLDEEHVMQLPRGQAVLAISSGPSPIVELVDIYNDPQWGEQVRASANEYWRKA